MWRILVGSSGGKFWEEVLGGSSGGKFWWEDLVGSLGESSGGNGVNITKRTKKQINISMWKKRLI